MYVLNLQLNIYVLIILDISYINRNDDFHIQVLTHNHKLYSV